MLHGWIKNHANLKHINMNYDITNFSIPSATGDAYSCFNRDIARQNLPTIL